MKRLNKKTYKSPKLFQYLAIKMCNHAMEILGGKKKDE